MAFRDFRTAEQRRLQEQREQYHASQSAELTTLTNCQLADRLELTVKHVTTPGLTRWRPGDPVYEAALMHELIPELIRRLRAEG